MTGRLSQLIKGAAEKAHRLQGSPERAGSDGRTRPGGVLGPFLALQDARRLHDLLERLSMTPLGCALLQFVNDNRIEIDFSRAMPAHDAGVCDGLVIRLNSFKDDDALLGTLCHELRHAWQHQKMADLTLSGRRLPPKAAVLINRFMEADAFAFEEKFLRDFARKTGDQKPLQVFIAAYAPGVPNENAHIKSLSPIDAARFESWNIFLAQNAANNYDLAKISSVYGSTEAAGMSVQCDKTPEELILNAVRRIDHIWSEGAQRGETGHYLAHLSDADLLSPKMTSVHASLLPHLDELEIAYSGFKLAPTRQVSKSG